MRSIRSFFPFWGCSSPRFDNTSWPLYWFHDGLNYISWLLSEHSMMVSLRTVPSIFSVFDTSIRRVDYALWAARWFHDSDKSYFTRSLPISSLLFLRNWTNRATLKKLNLMTSEPRERIFEPRKRRIETRFPRVVWLLDMNQPTVEPCFLIWGAIYEIATRKPLSNHEFQNATDRTCTVLCKSNASEMREFRSLFTRTFQESSRVSSSDNLRPFERNFPGTKNAFSSTFRYKTKFHDQKRLFTNLVHDISR